MIKEAKCRCLVIAVALLAAAGVAGQTQTPQERAEEQARRAIRAREIPEASLSSTTEEAKWWNDVRAAAKAIEPARAATKQREELSRLIKEGTGKSFQIPVLDRNATVLWRSPPDYTEQARYKRISGDVALAVELRPDGTIGEVKIVQSLDPGLDQMAVEAARKMVFLPAVKDRKFVSFWMPMTMGFSIY